MPMALGTDFRKCQSIGRAYGIGNVARIC